MPQHRNEYRRGWKPFGGWKTTLDLDERDRLARVEAEEYVAGFLKKYAGKCACCRRNYKAEFLTSRICKRCAKHVRCVFCEVRFQPSIDSDGRRCGKCEGHEAPVWARIERLPAQQRCEEYIRLTACPLSR